MLSILKKRLALFLHGNRDGVSVNYLAKSTSGIYLNTKHLIELEPEFSRDMLPHLQHSKELFDQVITNSKSITNSRWNAELELFSFLYSLIRVKKCKVIVETGVANGITTNAIMKAIVENDNNGALHSFDILSETKKVYSGGGNWNFHLLGSKVTHKQLARTIKGLPKVDLWVHDSNHGYRWQKFEYLLALNSLSDNGILVSDDVDASPAWGDLAKEHYRKSFIIFDSRKFFGIAFK